MSEKSETQVARSGKEQLIEDLRGVAEDISRTPSTREYAENGAYTPHAFYWYFDTWEEALKVADLDPELIETEQVSDEELLADLRAGAEALGKTPTAREMDAYGTYCSKTCSLRFGSWNEAVKRAGLEPNCENDYDR